jgi:DUF4097 and DUF4098 domain-containing protein YvlB
LLNKLSGKNGSSLLLNTNNFFKASSSSAMIKIYYTQKMNVHSHFSTKKEMKKKDDLKNLFLPLLLCSPHEMMR